MNRVVVPYDTDLLSVDRRASTVATICVATSGFLQFQERPLIPDQKVQYLGITRYLVGIRYPG